MKNKIFALVLLLLSVSFAVDTNCTTLSSAGTTYTLNASQTVNGATCMTITAANITLDCQGFTITGNNTTNTYGIYASSVNTTIKNCILRDFGKAGITITGKNSYSSISNSSAYAPQSSGYGILLGTAATSYVNITNSYAYAFAGSGHAAINPFGCTAGCVLNNVTAVGDGAARGIYVENSGSSAGVTINNSNAQSLINAILIGVPNTIVQNTVINGTASTQAAGTGAQFINVSTVFNNSLTAFNIVSANVSIDCQGAAIRGNNSTGTVGISTNAFNTTVKNCIVSNFASAIIAGGTNGSYINNTVSQTSQSASGSDGVGYFVTAAGNIITNGSAASAKSGAVYQSATPLTINNLAVSGVSINAAGSNSVLYANGITATNMTAVIISGANVTVDCTGGTLVGTNNTNTYGVYTTVANSTIRNCNISNFAFGVYVAGSSIVNPIIDNNTIAISSGLTSDPCYGAAVCFRTSGIVASFAVTNNRLTCTGNPQGCIYIFPSATAIGTIAGNTVIDDTTTNLYGGIYIKGGSNLTIANNTVNMTGTGTGSGIYVFTGTLTPNSNNITNNTITSKGSGVYIANGAGHITDCQGATMTGSNASATYGYYDTGGANTVKNCIASSFANGIYKINTNGLTAINNTVFVNVTNGYGMLACSASNVYYSGNTVTAGSAPVAAMSMTCGAPNNNNTFIGNTVFSNTSTYGGIYIGVGSNATLANNVINSSIVGIYLTSNASEDISMLNNTIYSPLGVGIESLQSKRPYIDCMGATIKGNNTPSTFGIYTSSPNATIKNCNINSFDHQIYLIGATNGLVINNTLIGSRSALAYLSLNASGNTLYWNNFTNTTGVYVNDTNGSNFYNTTEGNIYANVMNGSVQIWGTVAAIYGSGLIDGTNGSIPYNQTSSLGKFLCAPATCGDFSPLTTLNGSACSAWSIPIPISYLITYYTNGSNITTSWTNSTCPNGRQPRYSAWAYLENGTKNDTLITNTTANTTQWNTTSRNDLFYFIFGTACDNLTGTCTNASSAVFGVYTPSITSSYQDIASASGANVPNTNFTEFCNYTVYPNRTGVSVSAYLSGVGGGGPYLNSSYSLSNNSSGSYSIRFAGLIPGDYQRECNTTSLYAVVSSGKRTMSILGQTVATGDLQEIIDLINMVGTLVGFAILAFVFAYMHVNTVSPSWKSIWFMFSLLMVLVQTMGIQYFGNIYADTQLADIGLGLFIIFSGLTFFAFVYMTWTTVIGFMIYLMHEAKKVFRI